MASKSLQNHGRKMKNIRISIGDINLTVLAEPNGIDTETARLTPIVLDRLADGVAETTVSALGKLLPPAKITAARATAKKNFKTAHSTPEKLTELEQVIRTRITELSNGLGKNG